MHIADIIQRDQTTFSFEFFPPKDDAGSAALLDRMETFESLRPSFVSVTYGAGGSTRERTHALVEAITARGTVDSVPHLTCVNHSHEEVSAILQRYAQIGISNILALRGDLPTNDPYDADAQALPHAADLVAVIKAFNEAGLHPDPRGFGIGAACFPEGHPQTPNRLRQLEHLRHKVDAGVDWICTQMFFDNQAFFDFRDRCDLAGITVPILVGLMPITSIKSMHRMADLAGGTNFPARLQRRIARYQDDPASVEQVGIQWATEQANDLLDQGVAGVHFYTLNRSDATLRIFEALGAGDSSAFRAADA
jgi:methylenetetrahydrofolate reductase (NADPH)